MAYEILVGQASIKVMDQNNQNIVLINNLRRAAWPILKC